MVFHEVLHNMLLVCLGFLAVAISRIASGIVSSWIALRHVPGPRRSSFLWGEEWLLYHTAPGSQYVRWHQTYGKVVKFTGAFGHQVLSISDPRAISFIVGEKVYSFPKPRGVRAWFKATLGEGIVWVEGREAHQAQRRTLAPALSPHSVRNLVPIFHETSAKLVSQWTRKLESHPSDEIELDMTFWAGRFALDTVGRAAFSYDFDCLAGEPHRLADALDGLTNNEHKLSSFYMRALFWIVPSILSVGTKGEMIRRTKRELGEIASMMWRDAKVTEPCEGKTLMTMMLKADKALGHQLTETEIVSQMRTIISAGYETVSAIIAWMLYEISQSPSLQAELREEIYLSRNCTLDDLNKYPLLDATLKETLRLHPAILENHHEAGETITIPLSEPLPGTSDKHLVISKGTLISIPVNVVQTDPEVWGLDAHRFNPARWLERHTHAKRPTVGNVRQARDLFAFSEGPRSCIGKVFAMAEIKILVITLLQEFSFSCPHDIEPFQSFVIRPRVKGQGFSSLPLLVRKLNQ